MSENEIKPAPRGYIPPPNYTQVPNVLFQLFPEMSEAEMKITLVICRQTFGYHRKQARCSYTYLQKSTGMGREAIRNGLKSGIERGTIAADPEKRGVYALNIAEPTDGSEIEPIDEPENSSKIEPDQFENRTDSVRKSNSLNKESKENNKKKTPRRATPNPAQWWGIPDVERWPHPYDYVLYLWGSYFPEKPQPQADDKRRRERVARRWQDRNFWSNVARALEISATNDALMVEDWFNFDYVIRNPDTMQNMLRDWMRWKHDKVNAETSGDDLDFVDLTAQRLNGGMNHANDY